MSESLVPLNQSVVVYGYNSDGAGKSVAGVYGRDSHIEIYVTNVQWTRNTGGYENQKIMAHEYFHVVQSQLSGPIEKLPIWLWEGSAEYIGYSAAISAGLVTRAGALAAQRISNGLRLLTKAPALQGLETRDQWQAAVPAGDIYQLGYAAVDNLVKGSSLDALRAYFIALRASPTDWRPIFERTFGKSIDDFYGDISRLRAG